MSSFLFTSESVTEGHPDKMADQISDAILDAILEEDPHGHVACETLLTTGLVVVAGEISTSAYVDIARLAGGRSVRSATTVKSSALTATPAACSSPSTSSLQRSTTRCRPPSRCEAAQPVRTSSTPRARGPGNDVRLRL